MSVFPFSLTLAVLLFLPSSLVIRIGTSIATTARVVFLAVLVADLTTRFTTSTNVSSLHL